jgi:hypothetical protein
LNSSRARGAEIGRPLNRARDFGRSQPFWAPAPMKRRSVRRRVLVQWLKCATLGIPAGRQ